MLAYLDHDNTAAAAAQMWRRRRGGGIFHDLLPQSSAPTDGGRDGARGKGTKVRWNGRVRRRGRGRGEREVGRG